MAEKKFLNKFIYLLGSFALGFLFVVFLVLVGGGIILGKNPNSKTTQETKQTPEAPLTTYEGPAFTLDYPNDFQLNVNRIVSTQDLVTNQENTIQLISPLLPGSNGDMSMIITYKPYSLYQKEDVESSTCPDLLNKKLDPIKLGNNIFTTSGQIFCGPDQVAFFYILNNNTIYETKVETTADYESVTLPEVKKILTTMKFK